MFSTKLHIKQHFQNINGKAIYEIKHIHVTKLGNRIFL